MQSVVQDSQFVPTVCHLADTQDVAARWGCGALGTAPCVPTEPAPSARGAEPVPPPPSQLSRLKQRDTLMCACKSNQGPSFFSPVMLLFTFYPEIIFLCLDSTGLEISRIKELCSR